MMPEVNSLIVWIILGGFSGWIASKIMGRDSQMGIFLNIVVGVIGASSADGWWESSDWGRLQASISGASLYPFSGRWYCSSSWAWLQGDKKNKKYGNPLIKWIPVFLCSFFEAGIFYAI